MKPLTKEVFVSKANIVHDCKYDYSKVQYVNARTKVCIICPKHGEFWQTPHDHLTGRGCPFCKRETISSTKLYSKEKFVEKANVVHDWKYDYSKSDYVDSKTKICIICPKHGEFWQRPSNHLEGQGCPLCNSKSTTTDFICKAKERYGNAFSYDKVNYVDSSTKVKIKCNACGSFFFQTPARHLSGHGCHKCNGGVLDTFDTFVEKANKVHNNFYNYDKVKYVNSKTKVTITCPKHGDFKQLPYNHLLGEGCPKCSHHVSNWENEIADFLREFGFEVDQSNRALLNGKELDIVLYQFNLAIECDGLRWHSEEFNSDKNYHLSKTLECEKHGIRLIHIFEDEWLNKSDIWKSMLSNMLHKTKNKVYARKCKLKNVSVKDKNLFLNENHIQGMSNSSVNLGLYYNDELVSLMTFGKPRINMGGDKTEGSWELVRFVSKKNTVVVGGANKLFKWFIEHYKPNKVISYSDNRWAKGNVYSKLGFAHDHDSAPNYFYVVSNKRENRFKYRKDRLVAEGYDKNKTEHEIMLERKIYRIYDCGCKAWIWKNEEKK